MFTSWFFSYVQSHAKYCSRKPYQSYLSNWTLGNWKIQNTCHHMTACAFWKRSFSKTKLNCLAFKDLLKDKLYLVKWRTVQWHSRNQPQVVQMLQYHKAADFYTNAVQTVMVIITRWFTLMSCRKIIIYRIYITRHTVTNKININKTSP